MTAALAHGVQAVVVRDKVAERLHPDGSLVHSPIEARPAAERKRVPAKRKAPPGWRSFLEGG